MSKPQTMGVLGLTIAALLCCSDDDSKNSATNAANAGQILTRAYCEVEQRCRPVTFLPFRDVDHCVSQLMLYGGYPYNLPGVSITIAQAQACADAMREARCDEQEDVENSPVCMIPGTLADGEICMYEYQCASGYCARRSDFGCAVCASPAREGESCESRECTRNLSCHDIEGYGEICVHYFAKLGETCGSLAYGMLPCWLSLRCLDGTCSALANEGEVCSSSNDCAGLMYCDQEAWNVDGTCRPRIMASAGEDCMSDNTLCKAGLYCARIDDDGDNNGFANDGKCAPVSANGASCAADNACLEPFWCVKDDEASTTGTCKNVMDYISICD